MKAKTLIPLVAILVVLGGIAVLKSMKEQPVTLEEAVQLTRLAPDNVTPDSLKQIELFSGAKPEEKVVLAHDAQDASKWVVTSAFNAPADNEKAAEFAGLIVGLKGELREENASDEHLADYKLTDEAAFQIRGYTDPAGEAAFTLLTGGDLQGTQMFARQAGSKDVYVIDKNPRREAGVWDAEGGTAPTGDHWIKKTILEIAKDTIEGVSMTGPDKSLAFERREVPKPEPAVEGEEAPETPAVPETPQYEWVLASGGPGTPHRQPGLDTLLRTFEKLDITSVADPATKAELGLEPAAYTCTVSVAGTEEDIVIEGGRPDPSGNGYLHLANADMVYEVPASTFEKVFGLGRSLNLFDLDGLTVSADDMARIDIVQPAGNVTLVKDATGWVVDQPKAGLEIQQNTLSTLTALLARWTPADFAMRGDEVFADAPARSVTVTLSDGTTRTITLGQDAASIDGAYARLDDGPAVLVMSRADIDKVFVEPSKLYQLALFDLAEDDVRVVTLARGGDSLTLTRDEESWNLTAGDATVPADPDAIDAFLFALVDLQAEDILFGQTALAADPEATLAFTTVDGTVRTLAFGPVEENKRTLGLVEQGLVATVDSLVAAELLVTVDSLKMPEPEPAVVTPAPDVPAPETPVEGAPVESAPEEVPAADAPAEPVVDAPAEPTPVDAPVVDAPAETAQEVPAAG
jgi:hypothetical protein